MFEALTEKFSGIFRSLSGRGRITERNVRDAMGQVRQALLEADVHYKVVREFCESVLQKALGREVIESLHPAQLMIKIVHDELVELMGPVDTRIYYVSPPPTIIMLAGLQGSGKTTTAGKLAKYILAQGKHPVLVACDLQRPAAVQQLAVVAEQAGVPCFRIDGESNPVRVARESLRWAGGNDRDVVIIDTAGRLHIDQELMKEAEDIAKAANPHQIYLVCDAMTGQDAVNSAREFNARLKAAGTEPLAFWWTAVLLGAAVGALSLVNKSVPDWMIVSGNPLRRIGRRSSDLLQREKEFLSRQADPPS